MNYFDDDGNSLGDWKPITEEQYIDVLCREDTSDHPLTVFATRTQMGSQQPGEPPREQHIYTEWGRPEDETPLISCRDTYDYWGERDHTHMRFVPGEHQTGEQQ